MAFLVEDGSGVAGANSYATEAVFESYCDDRGITPADGDVEPALVRATQWIDSTYRSRFQGQRVKLREQGLEWPRYGVADSNGFFVPYTAVPVEIIRATCEAAIRELAEAGSLAPDLDRAGNIKELAAGSVRVVYGTNATAQTTFQIIDGILAGLLGAANQFTARAVRA